LFEVELFEVELFKVELFKVELFEVELFEVELFEVELFEVELFAFWSVSDAARSFLGSSGWILKCFFAFDLFLSDLRGFFRSSVFEREKDIFSNFSKQLILFFVRNSNCK